MIPDYGPTYDEEAVFSPADSVAGEPPTLELPPAVVLGFHDDLLAAARDWGQPLAADRETAFEYRALSPEVAFVPVEELGVGAPAAAIATEKAIARGARVAVVLSSAAALQPVDPGAALLPTRAVRDEGASYHYLPSDEPVTATPGLVNDLDTVLAGAGVETHRGPAWTTSALFRETVPQVKHYRADGFVSVDMETAAVWAVCRYRGVDTATVHAVGGYLSPAEGESVDDPDRTGLADLLDPTVRALESYSRDGG